MQLGAVIGPMSPASPVGELLAQARTLESEGFDSLWVAQAVGRGMMLPDPLLALAAAAGATQRPRLGTAVLQLPLYHPPALAHQIFSLMHLAGDRLRIGVGAGSTESDFRAFGRDFASRFARFDANLAALRGLLAEGAGDGVDLSPWPAVQGGPPLLYGTWGKGVARAAREFSGWIASAMHRTTAQVIEALRTYRAHGGDDAIVSSIVLGAEPEPGAHRKRLDAFADAGFDEAVVMLLPGGPAPGEVRRWVESR
jgi:alkanesulfonate monooxygenase SsuD/methylene tetrahydromethanopterin reductase-like flavin-dependent oxidoreductase (luciferase family)